MSPHAAPIHLPCTMRVVVRVFPAIVDVVVTFVRYLSEPLNAVSPSDSEWIDVQAVPTREAVTPSRNARKLPSASGPGADDRAPDCLCRRYRTVRLYDRFSIQTT